MKKTTLLLLSALAFLQANAQKLPGIQTVSVKAPANVKIDGKATEWNNKFEADNATTELLYTIANDDKKLYLVAQTKVENVMTRITNGGIKLIVQKSGKKNDDGGAVVKFPYLENGTKPVTFNLSGMTLVVGRTDRGMTLEAVRLNPATPADAERMADSLMKLNNKKLQGVAKLIYTEGIAGINGAIPVYNDKGIEAAVAFDNKKNYTYEIAIDLKLLGLSAAKGEKFSYHLVVNGTPNKYQPETTPYLENTSAGFQKDYAMRIATTDLWGEYTLAK